MLIKAVVESTGRNKATVKAEYDKEGDLGIVASQSRSSQSTLGFSTKAIASLTAVEVLEQLRIITRTSGDKSMDRKVSIIKKLLVRCQKNEAKFLIRALQGKLRIGTAFQTILVALAHAFALTVPPGLKNMLEDADGNATNVIDNVEEDNENENEDDINPEEEENIEEVNTTIEDTDKQQGEMVVVSLEGGEPEPEEAIRLRRGKTLGRAARKELAVRVIKRAFSECPSLTYLVDALLKNPLYDIHKVWER